jgi:Fe-S oxidoreductase
MPDPRVHVVGESGSPDAGFQVQVPMQDVCCGRPLYDYGFLNMARSWLLDLIEKLRPAIRAGIPIVVLEPSCWAVFKDELTNILPNDEDAQRLQKIVYTLSDFLDKRAAHYRIPRLDRSALLHGHCHQKSLDRLNDKVYGELFGEKDLLKKMNVEFKTPTTGCCGMAGAFGFERGDHYDVSVACAERMLIPEVNKAPPEMLIIADGFSCREQIAQMTDRQAMHLAEVLQMAIRQGPAGPKTGRAEDATVQARRSELRHAAVQSAALVLAGVAAALLGASLVRERRQRS